MIWANARMQDLDLDQTIVIRYYMLPFAPPQWRRHWLYYACLFAEKLPHLTLQVAQLSQRDRGAGWISNGQKWKTGIERQYLQTI